MTEASRIRATARDGVVEVRALMAHEMESGQRKDANGRPIPAWHITEVTASLNGKVVLIAYWGPAISRNPFLRFRIAGAKAGDKVAISWVDSKGASRSDEVTVG